MSRKRITSIGIASRVLRVTLVLVCSEGLYTLSHPVASSLIHIQHEPEYYTYLQLTVPLCYQHFYLRKLLLLNLGKASKKNILK
jgi:hypothetical protein